MRREPIKASFVVVLALSMLMVIPASAQTEDPPATPQGEQPAEAKQEAPEEPGKGKLSEFGETLSQFWSVSSAVQATQSFDDNVFLANTFRKSDTVTKLSGRVTVAYRGQRTRFEASYLPEFNLYQRYDPMNYSSHNYMQTLRHDFSRRLTLEWNVGASQAPSRGNLPFKFINFFGMRFSMYAPEALTEGLQLFHGANSIGVTYRATPRWRLNAEVEGAVTHFSPRGNPAVSPVTKELIYSTALNLGAEFTMNPNQSFGFSVGETYFGAVSPSSHQHLQSVRVSYDHKLRRNYRVHLSVGPGFSQQPGGRRNVTTFYEVALHRQLGMKGFSVAFHRNSQVGLLQDSVTGMGGTVRANWNIGRRWATNWGGGYQRSEGSTGTHQLESMSVHGRIAYRLHPKFSPFVNYGYSHQKSLVPSPNTRNVNRNEIALGVVYNFGVIAGR
ncbi:MAG: hypothetical protein ABIP81_09120 [Terriglobales bacterium]